MIPRGARSLVELDPLPDIPDETAKELMSMFLYALGTGARLSDDPYAAPKVHNLDRLIFAKMPILCAGPGALLTVESRCPDTL